MGFLIEFYPAIDSTQFGLMIVFLIIQWRDVMLGIQDALYRNMLPFMWVIATVVAAAQALVSAPVHLVTGEPWEVAFDAVFTAIWTAVAVHWYRRWKNSGDDTWKKRRRKMVEKIQLVGDRLVPVPVTN